MMNKAILPVFWALLGAFILAFLGIFAIRPLIRTILSNLRPDETFPAIVPNLFPLFGLLFLGLGLALLILTIRARATLDRPLKRFLLLTSSSAVGVFASMLLHNLVYGAFIQFFGEDFWERTGIGDEPLFFMLAIFICPIAYLVGTVGSIVLMFRKKKNDLG